MAVAEKNSKAEETNSTTTRRKHRKKKGPTDGEAGGTTIGAIQGAVEGGKKRKTTKRDGAGRLRRALDAKMAEHTNSLAEVLTDKALHGDLATTKLMFSVVEGGKPEEKKKKKRTGQSVAERWANSPEWVGPMPKWEDPIERDEKADEETDRILPGEPF